MEQITENQLRESFSKLVVSGAFRRGLGRIVRDDEDKLWDAVDQTYELARRNWQRGRVLPEAILVRYAQWRAGDHGRQFVPADGAQRLCDAMNPHAYHLGRVEVHHVDFFDQGDHDHHEDDALGLAVAECPNPARKLNSAIDLDAWLSGLAGRDRVLLAMREAGCTLDEMSVATSRDPTTVCTRITALGHELAQRVGVEVGAQRRGRPRREVIAAA
ncbi:MAG: hypothetical protein WCJ30_29580 [Deltaproteobacteria bacterium]